MVSIYLKAFLISLAIFLFGLLVGLSIERYTASDLISKMALIESSIQEIELELLYFQSLNESHACDFLNEIIRDTNNKLDLFAGQLLTYSEKNVLFTRNEIESLKRKYTYFLIKSWLLQEKVKESCGTKAATILYFYSKKGCEDCIIQGNILSILKNSFKEKLMVYPLDVDLDLAMLKILMSRYNITSTPSLVISDNVYSGIVPRDRLLSVICKELKENITACL